jgi:acetoin:2,6-dichlorophenolindophenol oxidoreductase subunit beta
MVETAVTGTTTLTYAKAANAALARALDAFPEALLYGEDVAVPGGVFGVTKGLRERFGERVFDTPISETAMLGAAVGAAMMGRRPIVEIMWVDFSLVALDQIVNQAANVRYVSGGRLTAPLTIRTQQGVLPGSCAQHSQSLEAFFAHVPGLRVAMPSDPQQAYSLLLAAIACDDPAVVIEHRGYYHTLSGEVDLDAPIEPVGGARVVRPGSHVTVVALGPMVQVAMEAAEQLAGEGIEAEVIDPRWIAPLDTATILGSVQRTGRIVIAHQANVTGGFGAEIAARVAHDGFWSLDAPIERVGVPDSRIPAAPVLQAALVPGAADIAAAVRRAVHA